MTDKARNLRNAFSRFATGVTVVTTRDGEQDVGMTCSSFSSVSLDPPLVLWSIQKDCSIRDAYVENGHYTVSVLSAEQTDVAMSFASGEQSKRFEGVDTFRAKTGNAILSGSVAWFDCRLKQVIDAGDHEILLAEILDFSESTDETQTPGLVFEKSRFGMMRDIPKDVPKKPSDVISADQSASSSSTATAKAQQPKSQNKRPCSAGWTANDWLTA